MPARRPPGSRSTRRDRSYPDPWHKPELVLRADAVRDPGRLPRRAAHGRVAAAARRALGRATCRAPGGRRPGRAAAGGGRPRRSRLPRPEVAGLVAEVSAAPRSGARTPSPRRAGCSRSWASWRAAIPTTRRAGLAAAQRRGAAARRGAVVAPGRRPRARVRSGAGDHGRLRQRAARGPDARSTATSPSCSRPPTSRPIPPPRCLPARTAPGFAHFAHARSRSSSCTWHVRR